MDTLEMFTSIKTIACNVIRRKVNRVRIQHLCLSQNASVTEADILNALKKKFPKATVVVEDTSGGCGAMFNIVVKAQEFEGLSVLKQHQSVYDALSEQIKRVHGLHLVTAGAK
ncbi:bolA-like protein 3 [Cylas formicarius]|uniref:bolA-like protein 3 n=1 Tax=Cylas formicarius TaxID=197179 RepID=UPI002958CBAC|nr:bolA-like protein 3 [Cylas formicarius]